MRYFTFTTIIILAAITTTLSVFADTQETFENVARLEREFNQADETIRYAWLKEDAEKILQDTLNVDESSYLKFLKRIALEKLVDTSYFVALFTKETDSFYSGFSKETAEYSGLKKYHDFLSQNLKNLEKDEKTWEFITRNFYNNLVVNALRVEALRHSREKLTDEYRAYLRVKDQNSANTAKQKILEHVILHNQVMTLSPLAGLLSLDVMGPKGRYVDPTQIRRAFEEGMTDASLQATIVGHYEAKIASTHADQVLVELLDLTEESVKAWTRAYVLLVERVREEFSNVTLDRLYTHTLVRAEAAEFFKTHTDISSKFLDLDRKIEKDLGFDQSTLAKKPNENRIHSFLEWGGYLIHPLIGSMASAVNTVGQVKDDVLYRYQVTEGYFTGLNDYEAAQYALKPHASKSIMRGLSHIGVGLLISYASMQVRELARSGKLFEVFHLSNLKSAPSVIGKTVTGAIKGIDRRALFYGFTNMIASAVSFIEISMRQRGQDMKTLFTTDGNFRRDFTFSMIGDFLLGFFTINASYMSTALIQGSVTAFSSITATVLEGYYNGNGVSIASVDPNRVMFDTAFSAFLSNAKYRYIAQPFSAFMNGKLLPGVVSPESPRLLSASQVASTIGVSTLNNYVGNFSYVYLARQLEKDELENFLRKRVSEGELPVLERTN